MSPAHPGKRLAQTANIALWVFLAFVLSAVLWFQLYEPRGDTGRGLARIFGAVFLLALGCASLVVSALSRAWLVWKIAAWRTRGQYAMLAMTAVPAAVCLVSFAGFLVIAFYEKYLM